MSKRTQGSANESLAEALSRVMVTREEADHRDTFDWATHEGRGDRMPRFLERAIEEVPHAARSSAGKRYQGRTRPRRFARTTFILSSVAVAVGVCVSLASPSSVAPLLQTAHHIFSNASMMGMAFTSQANAATPRLAFGEALLNYSGQAALQASRADIYVSDLAPGTTLSAGRPVSDTAWSLPQSDLDKLVITFPNGAPSSAMRATVEIPGNTAASSGKFSVEMRQANETADAVPAAAPPAEGVVDATAEGEPTAEADKPVMKARSTDTPKTVKRKVKPSAAVKGTKSDELAAAKPKTTDSKATAALAAAKSIKPAGVAVADADSGSSAPASILNILPTWSSSASSPNALTMFSLGGPITE